jgi:uncharacterized protein YegP (UPF0339 family)
LYSAIYKTSTGNPQKYWWVAKGANHEKLCASEMLSSKQTCISAINVVKQGARTAEIKDQTGER